MSDPNTYPSDIEFVITDPGDPSVGINGGQSTVTTWINDAEHLAIVRESLRALFIDLHDHARVRVDTAAELAAESQAEADELDEQARAETWADQAPEMLDDDDPYSGLGYDGLMPYDDC